jgi:hypothetical protein
MFNIRKVSLDLIILNTLIFQINAILTTIQSQSKAW